MLLRETAASPVAEDDWVVEVDSLVGTSVGSTKAVAVADVACAIPNPTLRASTSNL